MKNIIQKELSYALTGVSFEVAKRLGKFCRERQYADCFEQVLLERKIPYRREVELKGFHPSAPAGNKVDFLLKGVMLVDLKAKRFVTKEDYYQMQRYLSACNLELGLIINFRNSAIKPLRVLNSGYSGINSGHLERVKGFSLVETLLYTAVLSLVLLVVAETTIAVIRSTRTLRVAWRIERDAGFALERMVREIRDAESVNLGQSVLGAHPGALALNTTNTSGEARAVLFSLTNGALYLTEDGVVVGPLSSEEVTVSNLIFRHILTGHSEGVKIELALSSGSGGALRTENFYATAVLRDSY